MRTLGKNSSSSVPQGAVPEAAPSLLPTCSSRWARPLALHLRTAKHSTCLPESMADSTSATMLASGLRLGRSREPVVGPKPSDDHRALLHTRPMPGRQRPPSRPGICTCVQEPSASAICQDRGSPGCMEVPTWCAACHHWPFSRSMSVASRMPHAPIFRHRYSPTSSVSSKGGGRSGPAACGLPRGGCKG